MAPVLQLPSWLAAVVAAALLVVIAAAMVWAWLDRCRPRHGWPSVAATDSVVAGVSAALAMVPIGLVVSAMGFEVNRYGRLVAVVLTGSDRGVVLLALHALIGIVSACPLVLLSLTGLWPQSLSRRLALGLLYGGGYWLAVNALALSVLFGHDHPWARGISGVWPSLLVHLVYGIGVGAVLHLRRQPVSPPSAAVACVVTDIPSFPAGNS